MVMQKKIFHTMVEKNFFFGGGGERLVGGGKYTKFNKININS